MLCCQCELLTASSSFEDIVLGWIGRVVRSRIYNEAALSWIVRENWTTWQTLWSLSHQDLRLWFQKSLDTVKQKWFTNHFNLQNIQLKVFVQKKSSFWILIPATCSIKIGRGQQKIVKAQKTPVWNISQVNRFSGNKWQYHDWTWKRLPWKAQSFTSKYGLRPVCEKQCGYILDSVSQCTILWIELKDSEKSLYIRGKAKIQHVVSVTSTNLSGGISFTLVHLQMCVKPSMQREGDINTIQKLCRLLWARDHQRLTDREWNSVLSSNQLF